MVQDTLPHDPPSVVPPGEVAEVHRRFEAGGTRGKTVLDIAGLAGRGAV